AGLQHDDTHSCGAIVIRHARYRMMGLPVPSGKLDRASAKGSSQKKRKTGS
ncbi:hypothetical protein V2G26_001801, partial [Clonostachys chloroleuca]